MFYEYEGEEDQHSENCNFIYGNCDCIMSDPDISEDDRIIQIIEKYDSPEPTRPAKRSRAKYSREQMENPYLRR